MSGLFDGAMSTAVQALAVFGAVTLLVIFFVGMLVIKATTIPSGPAAEKHLVRTINRHYLIFSGSVLGFATGLMLGFTLPVAFAMGVGISVVCYRLVMPLLIVLSGSAILYLLLNALTR